MREEETFDICNLYSEVRKSRNREIRFSFLEIELNKSTQCTLQNTLPGKSLHTPDHRTHVFLFHCDTHKALLRHGVLRLGWKNLNPTEPLHNNADLYLQAVFSSLSFSPA